MLISTTDCKSSCGANALKASHWTPFIRNDTMIQSGVPPILSQQVRLIKQKFCTSVKWLLSPHFVINKPDLSPCLFAVNQSSSDNGGQSVENRNPMINEDPMKIRELLRNDQPDFSQHSYIKSKSIWHWQIGAGRAVTGCEWKTFVDYCEWR